ncbi:CpsD/CapB family tyrosine-protein kinase [Lactococcus protaetiae]|uniref:Tyrosine-protein kinase CpsD n=1 Tax=Lactococcus protaetiae TaxID=2592653 RepID=A0A514Z8L8_9LACT|nr:CpsD/CapB family tyrosine-protein kinase [Lactococcus protaetiae]QDK70932.1 CpsD/CapB family tyrosine-protein kinase [Lactococcus protaetiae]
MSKKKLEVDSNRLVISSVNPQSPISEQYRTIRTNIEFMMVDNNLRTLLVTSAEASAGKSTLIANLAVVFAQQGKKVLLIDADLRKPTTHLTFRVDNKIGLTNVLTRQASLDTALQGTRIAKNLAILTSGPIPPNPSELLSSQIMKDLIATASRNFDVVLVDAPPVVSVTDAQILSRIIDGVVVAACANQTKKEELSRAKRLLEHVQANVLGCVLTQYESEDTAYYYYGV